MLVYFTTFHLMHRNCSTKPEDDLIQNQDVGRAFLFKMQVDDSECMQRKK